MPRSTTRSRTTTQVRNATQVSQKTYAILRKAMPGQSIAWYERIGQMIEAGVMPMPWVEPEAESWDSQTIAESRTQVKPDAAPMLRKPVIPTPVMPEPVTPEPVIPEPAVPEAVADVVSEATQAKLIAACKNAELAERLAAAEHRTACSEEEAWQNAYDKLMDERINLYNKIGYNS